MELGPGEGASLRARFPSPGRAALVLRVSVGPLGVEAGVEIEIPPGEVAGELRSIAGEIRSSLGSGGQG